VILMAGILRVGWPIGLAFVPAGTVGLLLVMGLELGLITSCGVFNPVIATYRLRQAAPDRVARTLAAWSISTSLSIAITTALWAFSASSSACSPPSPRPVCSPCQHPSSCRASDGKASPNNPTGGSPSALKRERRARRVNAQHSMLRDSAAPSPRELRRRRCRS
jgi:hypothetical protein